MLKIFPNFPDFRRFCSRPWINDGSTNKRGELKIGDRIGCDFLTVRAPARASCDGRWAPAGEGPPGEG